MRTRHKPILNHEVPVYDEMLDLIAIHTRQFVNDEAASQLGEKIKRQLLGKDPAQALKRNRWIVLDEDNCERVGEDLVMVLCWFAMRCDAQPPRTPKMLLASAEHIFKYPQDFLANSENYDPEVVALVLGCCGQLSRDNKVGVIGLETGKWAGPSVDEIRRAAAIVMDRLSLEVRGSSQGGRPQLVLQTRLACDLARIFRNNGGRITRITTDGETGAFHKFLERVLPPVEKLAIRAGFVLNVTTMVEKAQKSYKR